MGAKPCEAQGQIWAYNVEVLNSSMAGHNDPEDAPESQ